VAEQPANPSMQDIIIVPDMVSRGLLSAYQLWQAEERLGSSVLAGNQLVERDGRREHDGWREEGGRIETALPRQPRAGPPAA
jgi:hypothetical protein